MAKICIIGDIIVDYSINADIDKMRLGGIFHAGRGAWALDEDYELVYFAPEYLDGLIDDFTSKHNGSVLKIGNIIGAPNIILIKESKEIGNQGYELILRKERKYYFEFAQFQENLTKNIYSDLLIFTGGYNLETLLEIIKTSRAKIHIDISNDITTFDTFEKLNKRINTFFISTSSIIFLNKYKGNIDDLVRDAQKYCDVLIFKENRGGSRCFDFINNKIILVPSQTRKIKHSVGVGDNYDLAYISMLAKYNTEDALNFSSWFAMEYSQTTFPDDFKRGVERLNKSNIDDLKNMGGISLPWGKRSSIDIYIAAPDFDYIDTRQVDVLVNSLHYHNFKPRLPIREHGQLTSDSSVKEKQEICKKDIELLYQCKILIAVMLFDDPGTLIEIGLAISSGIPTLIYDPFNKAKNCILTQLPNIVSDDLDEIIAQVFILSSKLV